MQVGTTKDQGLYNKSSAAVHSGALAARTLPHKSASLIIYENNEDELSKKHRLLVCDKV